MYLWDLQQLIMVALKGQKEIQLYLKSSPVYSSIDGGEMKEYLQYVLAEVNKLKK